MTTEPRPTPCCQSQAYADPLCLIGTGKTRFASASRCSRCHKVFGDYRLDWTEDTKVKAIQKKFTMTGWAMMLDVLRKRPGAPLNFEMGSAGIHPENYAGENRHEAELSASSEILDQEPEF